MSVFYQKTFEYSKNVELKANFSKVFRTFY